MKGLLTFAVRLLFSNDLRYMNKKRTNVQTDKQTLRFLKCRRNQKVEKSPNVQTDIKGFNVQKNKKYKSIKVHKQTLRVFECKEENLLI